MLVPLVVSVWCSNTRFKKRREKQSPIEGERNAGGRGSIALAFKVQVCPFVSCWNDCTLRALIYPILQPEFSLRWWRGWGGGLVVPTLCSFKRGAEEGFLDLSHFCFLKGAGMRVLSKNVHSVYICGILGVVSKSGATILNVWENKSAHELK